MSNPKIPDDLKWRHEQDRAVAERAHDSEEEFGRRAYEAAVNAANAAIRTLVLINGGAAIAILAFIGSLVAGDGDEYDDNLVDLSRPLMWFAWGVALASVGSALAYVTNYCIGTASALKGRRYSKHPFVHETNSSERWRRTSNVVHILAMAAAVMSLAMFVAGMYEIREAIVSSTPQVTENE